MGDMADYSLEQVEEMELAHLLFMRGEIFQSEAYELGIINELGFEYNSGRVRYKTCRCCGKGGLRWNQHQGKWRLFENDKLHNCPIHPIKS